MYLVDIHGKADPNKEFKITWIQRASWLLLTGIWVINTYSFLPTTVMIVALMTFGRSCLTSTLEGQDLWEIWWLFPLLVVACGDEHLGSKQTPTCPRQCQFTFYNWTFHKSFELISSVVSFFGARMFHFWSHW